MARTALYAPAHRVMGRMPSALGNNSQPPFVAPSLDAGGSGLQDTRLRWNAGGANSKVPQVIGWYDLGSHAVIDVVPATASATNIAAAAAGVANTPLTLVTSSGAGVIVSSSATVMLPSLTTIPTGTIFQGAVTAYQQFGNVGTPPQTTGFYGAGTMLGRAVRITSAGNDSGGTASVVGWDIYGYLTHQIVTLANAGSVVTTKTFVAIQSITPTGTLSGGNISAGFADVFGLPIFASSQSALQGYWNNLILYGTGTFVAGVTTSPATALTGDVRGTWIPASASDGSKRLTLFMHPSLSQMITSGMNVGVFGVTQF